MAILCFLFLFLSIAHSFILQASDGDIVECTKKYNQPAFRHPLLKNHKIQEIPSEIPIVKEVQNKNKWQTLEAYVSIAKCPRGTVPIRKYEANSLTEPTIVNNIGSTQRHEYALASTTNVQKLFGAKTTINVWNPIVEDIDSELSISQIWIRSGAYMTNDLNTIEVGWQVCPSLYNDNKTRLFIYWTSDGYNTTGGYNLQKPGFIQTSSHIVVGGSITPISNFGGIQYEITILVWKDKKSGNWWLSLGPNNTVVGYWPAEIFTNLADHAKSVDFGGEIVNSHIFGRPTKTQMGSSHFPKEGFKKASYFRNIEIVDSNNNFQRVQNLQRHEDEKYYNIDTFYGDEWETYFFYGGPGFIQTYSGVVSLKLSLILSYVFFSFIFIF